MIAFTDDLAYLHAINQNRFDDEEEPLVDEEEDFDGDEEDTDDELEGAEEDE
jgi:hypothetical protein